MPETISFNKDEFYIKPIDPFGYRLTPIHYDVVFPEWVLKDPNKIIQAVNKRLLLVVDRCEHSFNTRDRVFYNPDVLGGYPPETIFPHTDYFEVKPRSVHFLSCNDRHGRKCSTAYAKIERVYQAMYNHRNLLQTYSIDTQRSGKMQQSFEEFRTMLEDSEGIPLKNLAINSMISKLPGIYYNSIHHHEESDPIIRDILIQFATAVQTELDSTQSAYYHSWEENPGSMVLASIPQIAHYLPMTTWEDALGTKATLRRDFI